MRKTNFYRVVADGKQWYHQDHANTNLTKTTINKIKLGTFDYENDFSYFENFTGDITGYFFGEGTKSSKNFLGS